MEKILSALLASLILFVGCSHDVIIRKDVKSNVTLPIAEYSLRLTYKAFGEFIEDRFRGYHTGDDIEYGDIMSEVPVSVIAHGTVIHSARVSGYGGLVIVKHIIGEKTVSALYGHLDLSSTTLKKGDSVSKGQFLANLGDEKSAETDGERKHLHFALYEGDELRLQGYESSREKLNSWMNPSQFFLDRGVALSKSSRSFNPKRDLGGDFFNIQFTIPEGWEVEYVPSLQALNLFTLSGSGSARDRSKIFIRYFDASNFLTLPTVKIHETTDLTAGAKNYRARRYDIEKKPGVSDFKDQPLWRNKRHTVTDFTNKNGLSRYYVVAANPELDPKLYESVLASMTVEPIERGDKKDRTTDSEKEYR